MINRIVLFQFKPTVALERIESVMELPKKWKADIPALTSLRVIRNTQPASASKYLYAFLMSFRTAMDIELFSGHELHRQFIGAVAQVSENIQVFDY